MPVKRDDAHTIGREQRHIIHAGKIVGVDVQFELRTEIEWIAVQEAGIDAVIAGHAFYLRSVQPHSARGFGNIGKPSTRKTGKAFARPGTVALLCCNRFRGNGQTVVAKHTQNAFHQGTFAVAGGCTVQEKQTFKPGIAAKSVPQCLL